MRKNIAILIILNLAIFGLYYYLLVDIRRSNIDTSSKLAQINLETMKKEQLQSVKILMDETKIQRDKVANLFVQQDGSVGFIEMVESLGGTTGVKLNIESVGIGVSKAKIGSSTESIQLVVKTEGAWADVMHLLSMLESLPFKVSFDSVVLNKLSEASSPTPSMTAKKSLSYWNGSFGFSVLKIKNTSQILQK